MIQLDRDQSAQDRRSPSTARAALAHSLRRFSPAPILGALVLVLAPTATAAAGPTFYEVMQAKSKADPTWWKPYATRAPEMASFDWILGKWTCTTVAMPVGDLKPRKPDVDTEILVTDAKGLHIFGADDATAEDPFGTLFYDPVLHRFGLSIGGPGTYGTLLAPGWQGDRIVFEGDLTVVSVEGPWRQTITKIDNDHHVVDNEQKLSSGAWFHLDHVDCVRVK